MTLVYWLFQSTKNKFEFSVQIYRQLNLQNRMFNNTDDFHQYFGRR